MILTGFLFAIGVLLAIWLINNLDIIRAVLLMIFGGILWLILKLWWVIPMVILLWIFLAFLISV